MEENPIDARIGSSSLHRSEIAREMPANKSQDKSGDKGKTPATPATQNTNLPKSGQSGTPRNTQAPDNSSSAKEPKK